MIETLCVRIFTSSIFQLYPFGYASGDAALSYPSSGEGSSSSISLINSIYFYDEMIRTAYVRYKLKTNSNTHTCTQAHQLCNYRV